MNQRIWKESQPDVDLQMKLARELKIHPITAAILIRRDIRTEEDGRRFLYPSEEDLFDPFLLPDMDRAVERIQQAVRDKERVVIYGDYDVDGISAIALYLEWFNRYGCPAGYYIPHRVKEGYGLNQKAVRDLYDQGTKLLITADCGTTSVEEVEFAKALGLDVIITDHHEVATGSHNRPPAVALINPKRPDSKYPFTGLCTAGLVYKVIQALEQKNGRPNGFHSDMLDLVALGTLADVSPVTSENRYLITEGLKQLSHANRVGISALKASARVENKQVRCGTVGFTLAPRINAVGRLAVAGEGVKLLTTKSRHEADRIAAQLEVWNSERQRIEQEIFKDVEQQIRRDGNLARNSCVVLSSPNWHVGVIGIVASRVAERYGRPTVLIALDGDGQGKGSARSVPGFHLQRSFEACSDLLLRFGGHSQAAGLTIRKDQIPAFRERLSSKVLDVFGRKGFGSSLAVDAIVELEDLKFPLIRELERLQPYGIGNPEPTLAIRGAAVVSLRVVGKNHLKFKVKKNSALVFEAIGYRMGDWADRLSSDQRVNLAFTPEIHEWRGEQRAQLRIKDIQYV